MRPTSNNPPSCSQRIHSWTSWCQNHAFCRAGTGARCFFYLARSLSLQSLAHLHVVPALLSFRLGTPSSTIPFGFLTKWKTISMWFWKPARSTHLPLSHIALAARFSRLVAFMPVGQLEGSFFGDLTITKIFTYFEKNRNDMFGTQFLGSSENGENNMFRITMAFHSPCPWGNPSWCSWLQFAATKLYIEKQNGNLYDVYIYMSWLKG